VLGTGRLRGKPPGCRTLGEESEWGFEPRPLPARQLFVRLADGDDGVVVHLRRRSGDVLGSGRHDLDVVVSPRRKAVDCPHHLGRALGRRVEIDGCNDLAIDLDLRLTTVRTQRRDPRQACRWRCVRWLGSRPGRRRLLDGAAERARDVDPTPAAIEAGSGAVKELPIENGLRLPCLSTAWTWNW